MLSKNSCSSKASSQPACSSSRKAVQYKTVLAIGLLQPLGHHVVDQFVGHQFAPVHGRLGLRAQFRSTGLRSPAACRRSRSAESCSASTMRFAWVPLPAPGGPNRTTANLRKLSCRHATGSRVRFRSPVRATVA